MSLGNFPCRAADSGLDLTMINVSSSKHRRKDSLGRYLVVVGSQSIAVENILISDNFCDRESSSATASSYGGPHLDLVA